MIDEEKTCLNCDRYWTSECTDKQAILAADLQSKVHCRLWVEVQKANDRRGLCKYATFKCDRKCIKLERERGMGKTREVYACSQGGVYNQDGECGFYKWGMKNCHMYDVAK